MKAYQTNIVVLKARCLPYVEARAKLMAYHLTSLGVGLVREYSGMSPTCLIHAVHRCTPTGDRGCKRHTTRSVMLVGLQVSD